MKRLLCFCIFVVAAVFAGQRAEQHPIVRAESTCVPTGGGVLRLCDVYWQGGGLILEFSEPVSSGFFLLRRCNALVETWSRREDIGDAALSVHFLPQFEVDDEGFGIGVGVKPPFVAVRLTGDVLKVEDIVYAK